MTSTASTWKRRHFDEPGSCLRLCTLHQNIPLECKQRLCKEVVFTVGGGLCHYWDTPSSSCCSKCASESSKCHDCLKAVLLSAVMSLHKSLTLLPLAKQSASGYFRPGHASCDSLKTSELHTKIQKVKTVSFA